MVDLTLDAIHKSLIEGQSPENLASLEKMRTAFQKGIDLTEAASIGKRIGTQTLLKDARRLLQQTFQFWKAASLEEKSALLGISQAFLYGFVVEAQKSTQMLAAKESNRAEDQSNTASTQTVGKQAYEDAMHLRKFLIRLLKAALSPTDPLLPKVIEQESEVVDFSGALVRVQSLLQLVAAGLSHTDADTQLRFAMLGIDQSHSTQWNTQLKGWQEALVESQQRQTHQVAQAALDVQDGILLYYIRFLLQTFQQARDFVPSIPNLYPITTRSVLGMTRSSSTETPSEDPAKDPATREDPTV